MRLHPELRKRLKVPDDVSDDQVIRFFRHRTRRYCKPCWELKYCPYGPLVEDFPLLPISIEEAREHQTFFQECLAQGYFTDGSKLTAKKRLELERRVTSFREEDYPTIPRPIADAACRVFGHMCPVFEVGEAFTETKDLRRQSRSVPRDIMLKVVRRDGQICQSCFQPVPDNEVEFDHVIPFSKGGTTTADNLKLCCRTCNRRKGDSLSDILSQNPIEHLTTIRKRRQ